VRIAIAEIGQETDTFSPISTELRDFETYGLYFGADVLDKMRGVDFVGGFLEAAEGEEATLLPIIRAWAGAGGTITADTLTFLTEKLVIGLKQVQPIDGLYLALHGAAATEIDDDLEGYVLTAVREAIGPDIPIVAPLDHHANITTRMIASGAVFVGHETQPHNLYATGLKGAKVLFKWLKGQISPTGAWQKIPMLAPQDQFLTSSGPMKVWFDLARAMERRTDVVAVSPFPMQPWLDVAEAGWAAVVYTDNDPELAQRLAAELANQAWRLRDEFWISERVPPDEAIQQALAAEAGLIILSDTGDSVYGGAPGDSTCLLKAMLKTEMTGIALVPMIDPEALEAAIEAGVGQTTTLSVGGKWDNLFSQPVEVTGTVSAISQGLTVKLPTRGYSDLGKTALLEIGNIKLVLLEKRSFVINQPLLYAHLGLAVDEAKMVVVKTASNFQFFAPWRKGLIRVDSPGTTQSDLHAFQWRRAPRPIYPLDEGLTWRAST